MKFSNGNKKDCHKKRPKTRIFACLCPCSVLEYVDTENSLKKKNGKNNENGCDAGKDIETRIGRNIENCEAEGGPDDFVDIPPLLKDNPDMPMGPSPCRDGARPMRRPMNAMHGYPSRGPQRNTAGDSILTKPLKIVFEEVDCSTMDFSACNKPPSAGDCVPGQQPPQQCPAPSQRQQRCLPPALQRCLPPSNPSLAMCPKPKCPNPCQPQPQCPSPSQQCPPSSPCPMPTCPPPPKVNQRLEFRLDKQGQIVDKCIPIGSPSILNISRDASCPMENTIKITYCGMGTEKGATKEEKPSQGEKPLEDKKPSGPKKSAESSAAEDKASKTPSTTSEKSVEVEVNMALGPYLEKSEESLERIIGIRSSNIGLPVGPSSTEKIVSEVPEPLVIRPLIRAPMEVKPADDSKLPSLLKKPTTKFIQRQMVDKRALSNHTVKETRLLPKKPIHRVIGLHREEFLQSTHQTRRVFGYTMKATTNPNSVARKLFKETSV